MQTQFSELTDSQWQGMKYILPVQRKRKHDLRAVINALFYFTRCSVQWRNLPWNFPPWKSVYYYFRKWTMDGTWQMLNDWLVEIERACEHKEAEASVICVDSQSVKARPFVSEERGIDGNKKINGRKRHILVDTLGLILGVVVSAANSNDGQVACQLIERNSYKFGRLKKILVDAAYKGTFSEFAREKFKVVTEVSSKPPTQRGFVPFKQRWVVERSLSWLNFFRRLDKDHEKTTKSSESMLLIANIQIILGRFNYS